MQTNRTEFEVNHMSYFYGLRYQITSVLSGLIAILLAIRFLIGGYDYAFKHITPTQTIVFIIGLFFFDILLSYFVALWMKRGAISLENGSISGLNFWGFRNSFPLNEIVEANYVSSGLGEMIAVQSKDSGKIYICAGTRGYEKLAEIISRNIDGDA